MFHSIADQSSKESSPCVCHPGCDPGVPSSCRPARNKGTAPPGCEAVPADPVERRATGGSHRPQHLHGRQPRRQRPRLAAGGDHGRQRQPRRRRRSASPRGLRGTIALTSGELSITDDLRIDGPGAGRLAVSGNDASRVFQIGSGVAVSIDDLTITHGRGLLAGRRHPERRHPDPLPRRRVRQPGRRPPGRDGAVVDAFGGGIFNTGTLTVRHTTFVHNRSIGADGTPGSTGSSALGGAIMSVGTASAPATATVSHSTFLDNQAIGGAAGAGASRAGIGGAIMNATGTFTVSHSVFRDNQAVGGLDNGVPGGFGAGSAAPSRTSPASATRSSPSVIAR